MPGHAGHEETSNREEAMQAACGVEIGGGAPASLQPHLPALVRLVVPLEALEVQHQRVGQHPDERALFGVHLQCGQGGASHRALASAEQAITWHSAMAARRIGHKTTKATSRLPACLARPWACTIQQEHERTAHLLAQLLRVVLVLPIHQLLRQVGRAAGTRCRDTAGPCCCCRWPAQTTWPAACRSQQAWPLFPPHGCPTLQTKERRDSASVRLPRTSRLIW